MMFYLVFCSFVYFLPPSNNLQNKNKSTKSVQEKTYAPQVLFGVRTESEWQTVPSRVFAMHNNAIQNEYNDAPLHAVERRYFESLRCLSLDIRI